MGEHAPTGEPARASPPHPREFAPLGESARASRRASTPPRASPPPAGRPPHPASPPQIWTCRDIVSSVNDVIAGSWVYSEELLAQIGAIRRVAGRAVRQAVDGDPLPPARSELLRLANRSPGISVADAARELGLAPNSVSTLVGKLTHDGLLRRDRGESDGRSAELRITDAGSERIARWRDIRVEFTARGMARLDPADQRAIADALPALARLAAQMESD
jgi:DNA-binding MarR family transcriptional regulator